MMHRAEPEVAVAHDATPQHWLNRFYFRPARTDDEPYLRALGFRGTLELETLVVAHHQRPTAQPCAAFTLKPSRDTGGTDHTPDTAVGLYLGEPRALRAFLPAGLRSAMWDYAGQRAARLGNTEVYGEAGSGLHTAAERRAAGVEQIGTTRAGGRERAVLRRIPGTPFHPERAVDFIDPLIDWHPNAIGVTPPRMPAATELTLTRERARHRNARARQPATRGSKQPGQRKRNTASNQVELRPATIDDVPQVQEMFHAAASMVAGKYPALWDFWDRPRTPEHHLGQIERGELYMAYDRRKRATPVGTIALLEKESLIWTDDLQRALPPRIWDELMATPAMYFEGLISRAGIGTEILEGARQIAVAMDKQELRANVWTVGGLADLYLQIGFTELHAPGLPLPLPRRAGRMIVRDTEQPFTTPITNTPTRLSPARTRVKPVTVYGDNPPPAASRTALGAARGHKRG